MASQQQLARIKEDLAKGISKDAIKASLVAEGWSSEDATGALALSELAASPFAQNFGAASFELPKSSGIPLKGKSYMSLFTWIILFIFVCAGVGEGTYWYETKTFSASNGSSPQIMGDASSTSAFAPVLSDPNFRKLAPWVPPASLTNASTIAVATPSAPAVSTASAPSAPDTSDIDTSDTSDVPDTSENPTISFTSDVPAVVAGGTVTLTWTSTNTTSCSASGAWSGQQDTSGSQTISGLITSNTYTLQCSGPGGATSQTLSIQVDSPSTPPPDTSPPSNPSPTNPGAPTSPGTGGGIATVAAGCTMPTYPTTVFYVDPVNGSASGDGSQTHPWQSLQDVLTNKISTNAYITPYYTSSGAVVNSGSTKPINPNGPIVPGDAIYLMSGNYGDIRITSGVNSDFITIAAAPGQTPVIHTLVVEGAAKWIFYGLKIQSLRNGFTNAVTISTHPTYGPVNDIIFDHNSVSSQDDVSSWTQTQWLSNAVFRAIQMDNLGYPGSGCLTIINNDVYNVAFGPYVGIDHTLFAGNLINNFGDDGLDYAASNIDITQNLITNNNDMGDGNHEDAMQQDIGRVSSYANVTIDSNKIIRQTSAQLAFPTYLEGIDAFDSDLYNLQVTNNVIITNTYHGISFSSVHGGIIANNTVLYDGSTTGGAGGQVWMDINGAAKDGAATNDLDVKNNIAPYILITTDGATTENNIASTQVSLLINGVQKYYKTAGVYGGNTLDPNLLSYLPGFNPLTYSFNVTPTASSPASGIGATLALNTTDAVQNSQGRLLANVQSAGIISFFSGLLAMLFGWI